MAAVSDPVPIAGKANGSGSSTNLATTPTAIEPATPVLASHGMAMIDSIPKHKGESDFRVLFDLPNATLLDGFSAALQLKSLLLHGRLYISSSAICFYSGVFGRKTSKVIRYDQMIGMYKRNTAKLFPNAIEVVTLQHRYTFCSFMFRDAAFRLAATAWSDYLEASPSNDTHRLHVNSKFDLELFVKKPNGGEEQVKMLEEPEEDTSEVSGSPNEASSSDGGGTGGAQPSSAGGGSNPGSRKSKGSLGDSGKSNTIAASPSGSSLGVLAVDSSEDADIGTEGGAGGDKKSKRRKSSTLSGRKKDVITSSGGNPISPGGGSSAANKRDSMDFVEDSEDIANGRKEAASPTASRNSVVVSSVATTRNSMDPSGSSATLKAKAVGFDLRQPASADGLPAGGGGTQGAAGSSGVNGQFVGNVSGAVSGANGTSSTQEIDPITYGDTGGLANPSGLGNPSITASSSSSASIQDKKTNSLASVPPLAAAAPSLPEIPFPIPTNATCKHILEETEDKKFSGTKLGSRTYHNLTLNQFFALVWCNRDYANALISHFGYTEWNAPNWGPSDANCCAARLLTYRMPLNASLGPKSTRVDSYQNARFKNANTLLIETSNISKDVPFGDAFEVHEKWTITQDGPDVNLEITAGVIWKKAAWGLKGTINQKSMEGVTENWEFVSKNMDNFIGKYTSAANASSAGSADAVPASSSSSSPSAEKRARKKQGSPDDEDSSESDDERRSRRKKKASRKNSKEGDINADAGSSPPSSHQTSPSESSSFFSTPDGSLNWKSIGYLALIFLGFLTLVAVFFSLSSVTTRLQQLEQSRHHHHSTSGLNHEEMNLRERVAFLEHLTTALLHNISEPGSYKSEQQRYWTAVRDMDKFLLKTKSNMDHLHEAVHKTYTESQSTSGGVQLSTSEVIGALRTLPIDRKVLNYLLNPDDFARQLANVLSGSFDDVSDAQASAIEASLAYSSWMPVYYLAAISAVCLIGVMVVKFCRSS